MDRATLHQIRRVALDFDLRFSAELRRAYGARAGELRYSRHHEERSVDEAAAVKMAADAATETAYNLELRSRGVEATAAELGEPYELNDRSGADDRATKRARLLDVQRIMESFVAGTRYPAAHGGVPALFNPGFAPTTTNTLVERAQDWLVGDRLGSAAQIEERLLHEEMRPTFAAALAQILYCLVGE
jgi:hypothetical protein